MARTIIKFKIPQDAVVYAHKNDRARNLLLYEVDKFEVLEEVRIDPHKVKFEVKEGQFVQKGDIIYSEGFMNNKIMVADCAGIVEISEDVCRILGQKTHYEKRINIPNAIVYKVIPGSVIKVRSESYSSRPFYYINTSRKLSKIYTFDSKKDINKEIIDARNPEVTTFILPFNIYLEDLAKLAALGVKRVILNSIFLDSYKKFKKEIAKFHSFALLGGFGEFVAERFKYTDLQSDIFWGKRRLVFFDKINELRHQVYEHPFWGITGKISRKKLLTGNIEYNGELFEYHLKNITYND